MRLASRLVPPPHAAHPPRRLHPALRSRCAPCSRSSLYDCAKKRIRGDEMRALRKLRRDYPRDAHIFNQSHRFPPAHSAPRRGRQDAIPDPPAHATPCLRVGERTIGMAIAGEHVRRPLQGFSSLIALTPLLEEITAEKQALREAHHRTNGAISSRCSAARRLGRWRRARSSRCR